MTNKNKKDFFSELEKELPFSPYGERFKEELTEHLEDSTEDYIKKGTGLENSADEALANLGKSKILSQTYIKYLRPDLLFGYYLDSFIIGSLAAILCLGYFFLSISSFFLEQAGTEDTWVIWTFKFIIPFLFFLVFYFLSLESFLQKLPTTLRKQFTLIIVSLPLILIGIWFVLSSHGESYLFNAAIKILVVNYTALASIIYISIRGPKKLPSRLTTILRYGKYILYIFIESYIVINSIILFNYPVHATGGLVLFLGPYQQLKSNIIAALGVGSKVTGTVRDEVWFYGILLTIVGIFCLANIILYAYRKKYKFKIGFPGLTLIVITYIISLFLPASTQNFNSPIHWLRPVTNVIEVIEKKQTGPFYRLYLTWFKNNNGYVNTFSGVRIVDQKFVIERQYTYNLVGINNSYEKSTIDNIQSIDDFTVTNEIIDTENIRTDIAKYNTSSPLILPAGFSCIEPITVYYTKNDPGHKICTGLQYNMTTIFSDNIDFAIISIVLDPQKKWALINFGNNIYLTSLP